MQYVECNDIYKGFSFEAAKEDGKFYIRLCHRSSGELIEIVLVHDGQNFRCTNEFDKGLLTMMSITCNLAESVDDLIYQMLFNYQYETMKEMF